MVEPAEVAALLAVDFKPDALKKERYDNVQGVLDDHPSPEMIDAFLEAAPGDRAEHLLGLLEGRANSVYGEEYIDPGSKLIIERMEPAERLAGLLRIFSDLDGVFGFDGLYDARTRKGITPLLLRLGHSEEEIRTLFPPERKE